MPGPLVSVDTIVAGVNLDVSRLLRLGRSATMKFMTPDSIQFSGWRVAQFIKKGFDRIAGDEITRDDGSSVIYQVARIKANAGIERTIRLKDLHVEVLGEIYIVASVEPLAPNEAQVYTLTCKTRTLRDKYFDNKR